MLQAYFGDRKNSPSILFARTVRKNRHYYRTTVADVGSRARYTNDFTPHILNYFGDSCVATRIESVHKLMHNYTIDGTIPNQ